MLEVGEVFLDEARQQVGIRAAFALEDLEHHQLLVRAALAQADIGGGAAAQRLDRGEAGDARRAQHGVGVGQAPGFRARDHARPCRPATSGSLTALGSGRIGLICAAGPHAWLAPRRRGRRLDLDLGRRLVSRTTFDGHAHDLREVRLAAQLRQPQQAFATQVFVVDQHVRVTIPAEIRGRLAVGGEVVDLEPGFRPFLDGQAPRPVHQPGGVSHDEYAFGHGGASLQVTSGRRNAVR